jgi:hypothetical protein
VKVTALAIVPPESAADCPRVAPELLASSLARYSRSNKGLGAILSLIGWKAPDKSVDTIFRHVDYGHASIAGLTGGVAIAIDGCSMLLAYKLFEFAQADPRCSDPGTVSCDVDICGQFDVGAQFPRN